MAVAISTPELMRLRTAERRKILGLWRIRRISADGISVKLPDVSASFDEHAAPSMIYSRRQFLGGLLVAGVGRALFQGVSSRNRKPEPRGKPSGLPWESTFTDVAAAAGLREITTYGEIDHKDNILETIGCGCAFFDYDHDGWVDLLVLGGTRMSRPGGTGNRLYHNNRDGTFTDVTKKCGLEQTGWASAVCIGDYNNDGWDDLFITYWGQNILYRNNGGWHLYRCDQASGFVGKRTSLGIGLHVRGFQSRWPPGSLCRQLFAI